MFTVELYAKIRRAVMVFRPVGRLFSAATDRSRHAGSQAAPIGRDRHDQALQARQGSLSHEGHHPRPRLDQGTGRGPFDRGPTPAPRRLLRAQGSGGGQDLRACRVLDRGERKEFAAMLEFAKAQNETVAIVADAVDRFQRSFKESVLIDELIRKEQIELLHFYREAMVIYREAMVIGKNASSTDILLSAMVRVTPSVT
jgi:hypothetical protein